MLYFIAREVHTLAAVEKKYLNQQKLVTFTHQYSISSELIFYDPLLIPSVCFVILAAILLIFEKPSWTSFWRDCLVNVQLQPMEVWWLFIMLLLSPQMTSCQNDTKISSLPTRNVILISTASTATATTVMATALSTLAAPYHDFHIQLWPMAMVPHICLHLWLRPLRLAWDSYCLLLQLWSMMQLSPAQGHHSTTSTRTRISCFCSHSSNSYSCCHHTNPAYGYHHHIRAIMLQQRFLFWHSYCATTYHETAFMWRVWLLPHYY